MDTFFSDEQPPEGRERNFGREKTLVLLLLTGLAIYLCYRLFLPFLSALTWAFALAVVARPLHDRISRRIPGRALAAGVTVSLVVLILVLPLLFVGDRLLREAAHAADVVQHQVEKGHLRQLAEQSLGLGPTLDWVQEEVKVEEQVRQGAEALFGEVLSVVRGSVWAVVQILVMVYVLFFLFRDRDQILEAARSLVPLSRRETDEVSARAAATIHAIINGKLATGLVQGFLTGLMFWWLGLPAPVLWGLVTAVLSVIPYLGSPLVWAPAALGLALADQWGKAVILAVWGTVVVGLSDNLLYPILVGKQARQHNLHAFFGIVGGLTVFGVAGIVLGPVLIAVTLALIHVWRGRMADGRLEGGPGETPSSVLTSSNPQDPSITNGPSGPVHSA